MFNKKGIKDEKLLATLNELEAEVRRLEAKNKLDTTNINGVEYWNNEEDRRRLKEIKSKGSYLIADYFVNLDNNLSNLSDAELDTVLYEADPIHSLDARENFDQETINSVINLSEDTENPYYAFNCLYDKNLESNYFWRLIPMGLGGSNDKKAPELTYPLAKVHDEIEYGTDVNEIHKNFVESLKTYAKHQQYYQDFVTEYQREPKDYEILNMIIKDLGYTEIFKIAATVTNPANREFYEKHPEVYQSMSPWVASNIADYKMSCQLPRSKKENKIKELHSYDLCLNTINNFDFNNDKEPDHKASVKDLKVITDKLKELEEYKNRVGSSLPANYLNEEFKRTLIATLNSISTLLDIDIIKIAEMRHMNDLLTNVTINNYDSSRFIDLAINLYFKGITSEELTKLNQQGHTL